MRYKKDYSLYKRPTKKGINVYYYRTYDEFGNRTIGRSTGKTSKTLAERYCNDLLRRGELIPVKDVYFNDYAVNWWVWEKCSYIRNKLARSPSNRPTISKKHAREMRSVLELYVLPTFGRLRLSTINPRAIETWMFSLKDKGLSSKRVNNITSCLRVMIREAVRLGVVQRNPFDAVRPFADNCQERGILTIDEVRQLFDAKNISSVWKDHLLYRSINLMAAATGMRQGEILALRDDDLKDGYVHVGHSWSSKDGLGPTKSRQERDVPIPSRVLESMKPFIGAGGFIFSFTRGQSSATGNRVTGALYTALKKIAISEQQRKKRNLAFHSWRHFFNSTMRARSVPSLLIQRVTGHSTAEMLKKYTHFSIQDYKPILAVQGDIFNDK